MSGVELAVPPSLRDFLTAGCDMAELLGLSELAVLAAAWDIKEPFRTEAADVQRKGLGRWLTDPPEDIPASQALMCRIRWTAELLEDPVLAREIEPYLRRRVPWPDWPDAWKDPFGHVA